MTHGHTMLALVHWASRREAATARSTGEAERVAGADCAPSTFPVAAALEDFVCHPFFLFSCAPTRIQLELLCQRVLEKIMLHQKNQQVCPSVVTDSTTDLHIAISNGKTMHCQRADVARLRRFKCLNADMF